MVRVKSSTVPLPDEAASPLGQSTAHRRVNIEPSEPVTVVRFFPGQGFAAMPVVPEVTGAELVVDAAWVVAASADVDCVEEELGDRLMVLATIQPSFFPEGHENTWWAVTAPKHGDLQVSLLFLHPPRPQ